MLVASIKILIKEMKSGLVTLPQTLRYLLRIDKVSSMCTTYLLS